MEPEKKSNGALIGLVVIVIILILGGLYMWKVNSEENTGDPYQPESSAITNEDADELSSLETDLQAADTSTGVDANTVN